MLVGYNTNITYKGDIYHIQTEDFGIRNPVIVTFLYLKGTILSSKKISYAHIASSPVYKEKVRELMKEQHKIMIRELISGVYTDDKTRDPSGEKDELQQGEESRQESAAKAQISKSLDDILLEYIIKRKD